MSKNANLQEAKNSKNDEFYTQLSDIEKELQHYTEQLKGKIIYCNCDNPEWSNFWKYFFDNFETLELKKIICTYHLPDTQVYKTEYDGTKLVRKPLKGNGSFESDECVEILKDIDIVVTNPPYSMMNVFLPCLIEHNKKFIVLGNLNQITLKENKKYLFSGDYWL